MAMCQGVTYACGFLAAVVFFVPACRAQELSHERAIEIALEGAPIVQAQRALVESAQTQSISAGRLPDPELLVGVDNVPVTGGDAFSLTSDFMTMRRVGVMQAFPNARKRSSERDRASAAVALSQSESRQTALEVSRRTSQAWFALRAAVEFEQQLRALRAELFLAAQASRAALASGRATSVETLAAQAALADVDDQIIAARSQMRSSQAELQQWIGESALQPLSNGPNVHELPLARERILGSLHQHAPVRTLDQQVALARSEIEIARAQRLPGFSTELVYAKRGDAFSDMVSIQFRVGLPLFTRNRQDPLIRAKHAELSQAQAERESELRMHAAEVTRELASWEGARERLELYERERLPLARERVRAAQAAYQSANLALSEVLSTLAAEIRLRREAIELTNQLAQAWSFLRYLELGEVTP